MRQAPSRSPHRGLAVTRGLVVFAVALPLCSLYGSPAAQELPGSQRQQQFENLVAQLTEHLKRVDLRTETLPAVDFPAGKEWFNSPSLSLRKELRGKITILDFWTYCCINCIHILPDLAALEKKYAGFPVAFVGVHSAKFDNEKDSENIRQAVLRYDIHHPVVNDDEMALWRAIGVRSWPTLVVIGPKGNPLLLVSGEGNRDVLDAAITAALRFYPPELFRHDPVPLRLEKLHERRLSPLRYPGKLAVDGAAKRLYISDSNHHRIVVTDLDGNFIEAIGSGRIGLDDGAYDATTFHRLQGIALDGRYLYVADAENHALRQVDLEEKRVRTLAGNGTQGRDYVGGKSGPDQLLSTPWDVAVDDRNVYIAMAGTHQIWVWDKEASTCRNYSGSGREQNLNHSDRLEAAWAQPSGLTPGGGWLFVADSESSSIRGIELTSGRTTTFVGGDDSEPRNLFDFGDVDGRGDAASLQHPLGVLWLGETERVLVTDTYNHRLKLLDHLGRLVETIAGSGQRGARDGVGLAAEFAEPSGCAPHPDGRRVFVADTNNHAIRLVDLTSKEVTTLELRGVPPPARRPVTALSARLASLPGTPTIKADTLRLEPGRQGTLVLRLGLPADHHFAPGTASVWQAVAEDGAPITLEHQASGALSAGAGSVSIGIDVAAAAHPGEGRARVEVLAYFCKKGDACRVGAVIFDVPVIVDTGGTERVLLDYKFEDLSAGLRSPLDFSKEASSGE